MKVKLSTVVSAFALLLAAFAAVGCGPSARGDDGDDDDPTQGCDPGFADCDGNGSCEDLSANASSCGTCGNVCGNGNTSSVACNSGVCNLICLTGFDNCNGDPADGCEAPLNTDTNCEQCNSRCSAINAVGTCASGSCELECSPGWGNCNDDFADGCESELNTVEACGACGQGCTANCVNGACETCDSALALASNDPLDAAKAIGLCGGVVSARWAMPDGAAPTADTDFHMGHGIMSAFGTNVSTREGSKLLGISSGTARQPNDPGYMNVGGFDKDYTSGHPAGFPQESPACPGTVTGQPHDAVALEVTLMVPDWAQGFSFDFDFYTYEWPVFVCSTYNDFFVALLDPPPAGQANANISFDPMGNPISVNAAFVSVCGCSGGPPCIAGGKTFLCPGGTSELVGTGFQEDFFGILTDHAATSWLTTTAPVTPGSVIKLRFGIYDSGDGSLDSTTLIDNFHWLPVPPPVGTEPIP